MTPLDDQAEKLLTALVGALTAVNPQMTIEPFVAAGEVSWDDCCNGIAYARLLAVAPSIRAVPSRNCPWLEATWQVAIVRCVSYADDGTITPAEQARSASATIADLDALLCNLVKLGDTTALTLGPEAGCQAAVVNVSMTFQAC